MPEVLQYPEGAPFTGHIGRTVAESTPAWPVPVRARPGAPNVLIILLDDVGFAQLGCFGGAIDTPTFDRLAAGGLRYRDFHSTALCTPTRACLMTGRNHHAVGCGTVTNMSTGYPGYNSVIPFSSAFIAEILQDQGYATLAVGKWHLTPQHEIHGAAPRRRWPLGRGFERFYGFMSGETNQWVPGLVEDNRFIDPPYRPEEGYHLNIDLADQAIDMLKELKAVDPDKPFFMYYCTGAGHTPHHAPADWIARYRGRFDQGWDRLREEILARQLAMGVVPPGTELSPRPDWIPAWADLTDDQRRLYTRQMEVYAAFLAHTDHHIGRVIDELAATGQLDNTLLLLTTDNGASSEGGLHGWIRHSLSNNGIADTVERNLEAYDRWGDPTTHPHYSWGWAFAGNTPLKRWKRYVHQGGISSPLVVHWPAGITARGEVRGQYGHVIDIAPTIYAALGIEYPTQRQGRTLDALHGVSFAHTFNQATAPTSRRVQYYEMYASRAIWSDGWKAVAYQEQGIDLTADLLAAQRWELYHVDRDFSECHDLAAQEPVRLQELIERWWVEAGAYNVLPLDARRGTRLSEARPVVGGRRERYVYYPHVAPVNLFAAANLHNRSHSITAEVEIPPGGAEGVLLAAGSLLAGYSLFVQAGHLHYVHNYCGLREYWVHSSRTVPTGQINLGFAFEKTGEHRGIGRLYFGDELVGEAEIAETVPRRHDTMAEGLCCGYDSGLPVTPAYQAPFRFSGTIRQVIVTVTGRRQRPGALDAAAELRHQ